MKINLVCVGKVKEEFYRAAIAEYEKRMQRYSRLTITEVSDEKTPDKLSDREREVILDKEGERIIGALNKDDFVIALAIEGKQKSSKELAAFLDEHMIFDGRDLSFVIGGSLGLSQSVMKRADMSLSFSKMTFPHQLMRIILLEQIYRSFRIMRGEPYDK
ncbi:MAG: 23S rRNA (pseudouridine(1915)-N(3))-methyltransferase RlmH [Lachnospiraceae bacterium]|nr:23S rRNA (pseudouridine(1915)-N(3))-methyltransferase RlmH [Lachnospiraceae bacterium]